MNEARTLSLRRHRASWMLVFLLLCVTAQAQTPSDSLLQNDGVVRILAIGNSFSQDAVEQYLYELGREAGIEMIIGNAYRGGQGFHSHWVDVTEANNTFEYRKVQDGRRSNKPRTALADIIKDEPWQYITFQQVSQESGLTGTFEPYLSLLIQYARGLQTNPKASYGFHQTWAYSRESTHGGFANYGNRQEVMYDSICRAVRYAMQMHPELTFVVPSGTAIQNARTTYLGDTMDRDGYHLDLKMGRYTAACVWFETITGISPVGFSYCPDGLDFVAAHTCQVAAHEAVMRPFSPTVLDGEGFSAVNDIVPTGLVKFNFGTAHCTDPAWNDITPDRRTHTRIVDCNGNATGILVTFAGDFAGSNLNGATATKTKMQMPAIVSQSALWGYAAGKMEGAGARQSATVLFSHLNPDLKYDISIFSSRQQSSDSRQTSFLVQGDGVWAEALQAADNTDETVVLKKVRPTADGRLTLSVMPGLQNSTANRFYYLNAVTIRTRK